MSIRDSLKQIYVFRALEIRRLEAELKWKYSKRLTPEERKECDKEVAIRYAQEVLSSEPEE